MNDGREVIAKLPNPNAGRLHFTTASEVATMDFLRNTLHLPVPKVHAWSSRASDNPVGAEYVIMEKQTGTMLSDVWETMRGKQKAQIVKQVVDLEKTLASMKFTKLGALYYNRDLPSSNHDTLLYVDGAGKEVHTEEFGIGPTNHRSFFDFGRGELRIDRGPWPTTAAYLEAVAHREIACVDAGLRYSAMPEGLFYGPGQYQPTASKKLSALRNYLKVAPYVLPENRATHASVLWHGDLHLQNVFVDPAEPTRIVGIIDWQAVSICPLFMQVTLPGLLDYNGPIPDELGRVSLPPNFDCMAPDEQQKAKKLHQAQTLHNLYLALSRQNNPTAFQAIKGQDSLRHQVSVVSGLTITDSEPCLTGLLREVEKEWSTIVGKGPDSLPLISCPLRFSATEVKQQEHDEKLWAQGVDLMSDFINETGCFKHWDGRVSSEDYEISKRQLADGIERFLSRKARSQVEREAWLKALPFVD
ncbi:phosphotransferase enzyme family protein [Histoplasma capsulatum H143]|uniref:Phosphotransferase enzyme family protein n=1 Tax=Ajellomyces capsulatus (strain H143) TaxID=544712 RepID=C6HI71_AJECH|nr:phosphotransferase enzyme family protein [Histoplasma capsulatum H143]